jgi:hypothetical protein
MQFQTVLFISIVLFGTVLGCAPSGTTTVKSPTESAFTEVPRQEDIFAITIWPDPLSTLILILQGAQRSSQSCWLFTNGTDNYFKDFPQQPLPTEVQTMLKTFHKVSPQQWKHAYSHVWNEERSGWLILNDGNCVQWMLKSGGLGWLRSRTGEMIYLAKSPPPSAAPSTPKALPREEQVQVVVLERMLKNWGQIAPVGQQGPQMNYLAVNDSFHLFGDKKEPRDPSENVMHALGAWQNQKFSDCVVKKNEIVPVTDRRTGVRGRIVWVGPLQWIDDQTAETSAGVWENIDESTGEMPRIHWEDGHWTVTSTGRWLT